jgi:hypothetical protein
MLIIRNLDFILSSLGETVQLVVNGFTWLDQSIRILVAQLASTLFTFLSKLPGVGGMFKDAAAAANAEAAKQAQNRLETEKKIAANAEKIVDNTNKSLARTKTEFDALGNKLKGTPPKATPGKPTPPRTKADLVGGGATPARVTPVPTPAPAAPARAVVSPDSFKPVQTAVNTGTVATQGVKTSTDTVRTAVQTAQQVSTTQFQNLISKMGQVLAAVSAVKSAMMAVSSKVSTQPTLVQVASNTAKANDLLSAINASIKSSSMMPMGMGGMSPPLGGAQGSLGGAAQMAAASGLQTTSSFRPGDKGYHGVGRAMDFSNSTGPTPQMMAYAQSMIAKYGSSLTELIYSPLGFSIKNGKKVAPLAYGQHFNHVHVAFAHGLKNPTFFTSAQEAIAYERYMAPATAKVSSVTTNSSENLGNKHTTVNQNISISGSQDPQRLAEMVFDYAARAAQRVNNASFA